MAKPISLLFILCAALFLLGTTITLVLGNKPNGFTMRLIHRDSPDSPFYPGNLTHAQTIALLFRRPKPRAQYLSIICSLKRGISTNSTISPNLLRPKAEFELHGVMATFLVEVGIGNFPTRTPKYIPYFLGFDTGSDTIWTQCEGCNRTGHCFHQVQPIFPNSQSTTFRPVLRGRTPIKFREEYLDNSSVSGIAGRETFTFGSVAVRDIVFGCATDCIGFGRYDRIPGNRLAGLMGAAWGSSSITGQLHEKRVISGSFSYCMPAFGQDIGAPPSTFLRFGDDIPRRQGMSTTSLVEYRGESHYYVNLVGISLAGRSLQITREVFVRRGHNTGTIIDSGADLSVLVGTAFNVLEQGLTNLFRQKGYHPVPPMFSLDVCFSRPPSVGYRQLPSISFVFIDGASLDAGVNKFFCLVMLPSPDGSSLIGAYQQRNMRVIYDIQNKKLHFSLELCNNNS